MSANDADDYVRREIDWIAMPLEKKPFPASPRHADAGTTSSRIYRHPDGHAEVGY
jgi:GMP synthase (glutamine-hydrolysing)